MDRLPLEIHLHIFKYLSIKDTLILKRVSRKWHSVLSILKPKSLTIVQKTDLTDFYLYQVKASKDRKSIYDLIENNDEDVFFSSNLKLSLIFKSLKELKVYFYSKSLINLDHFYNQFIDLELLHCYHQHEIQNKTTLRLSKLKEIKIDGYHGDFDLHTPLLSVIDCFDFGSVVIRYPERIVKLKGWIAKRARRFSTFENLEILVSTDDDLRFLTNQFLEKLTSLKEMHFEMYDLNELKALKTYLTYRRTGLKLYCCGFDFESVKINDEPNEEVFIYSSRKEGTEFIINYFDKSANLIHPKVKLDYNTLVEKGKKLIENKTFPSKFQGFLSLKIKNEVASESDLLSFINKINACNLKIAHPLSRSFYNQLIDCDNIYSLKLNDPSINILSDDFKFIYKMRNLTELKTHCKISLNATIEIFKNCENISELFLIDNDNSAEFIHSFMSVESGVQENGQSIDGYIEFSTRDEFFLYLKEKRDQFESDDNSIDIRQLIFAMNNDKLNKFLTGLWINKLAKQETFQIDLEL